jgi:DMSO/TMAO reductase YedYZ heme-binding membrane subunit
MSDQFWWYVCRASGLVAWAVLTLALIWGVLLAAKAVPSKVRPPWMVDLHRWLGGTALVLVGVHLAALLADSYVHFTLVDLLVPFASSYEPLGVAVGVLALYLLALVQVSSLAMRRIPTTWWRGIHMTSYGLVFVVSLHAVLTGTDVLRGFYLAATIVLAVAPVVAITIRLARPRPVRAATKAAPRTAERVPH